ncbi:MAG: fructose-1,6-bisphosphate aldolase/phosphatase [Candidatus Nanohaloarchaea archaeon]|nr:fructose-1,6-bisphosphate aldolase/phosphatase [Candidatus Nanohaloarchaea archaeon]
MGDYITVSAIKADVGGHPGHANTHQDLIDTARQHLEEHGDVLEDFRVENVGDDIQLIMTHREGEDSEEVHQLAWDAFQKATKVAEDLQLYGAGQDLLSDTFSGNVKGLGLGIAEMEFEERPSNPIVVFMMDKTEPGAFNLPVFKMFGDPFNTAGLVIDSSMSHGFQFEIMDTHNDKTITLDCPEEMHEILSLVGTTGQYVIKHIYPKDENKNNSDDPVASVSTEKLRKIAGEYVGKDDPVAIVRAQSGLPAMGEILEAFSHPHMVAGWMRGSHNGPMMPVGMDNARCTRFDGPPRVKAAGFQLSDGELHGPEDMFADAAFDRTREKAQEITDYMRRHGPFEPHRLPNEDMEYTALPDIIDRFEDRWQQAESHGSQADKDGSRDVE